jgi:hypothetical protein
MYLAQTRAVIAAGMIGNVLEWYDFAIYGYFAPAIGRQFFPLARAITYRIDWFKGDIFDHYKGDIYGYSLE